MATNHGLRREKIPIDKSIVWVGFLAPIFNIARSTSDSVFSVQIVRIARH